ncbi:AraC family transcriptional regulator [Aestuariicella hydrocarbonica]|uniref:AraC family transcriptional regulator n=1 Tax=Pseudomaricurvus hydrocarbonicus TaxID=1470433 RepID=A0A9E5JUV3_9GAMM|nr:AraC family transcriptional regulator [Aestuariicella hydrocarbonica]NHO65734.1 AraC family transcriptional regulator [Aestuariicella hydrocarbonica]
MPFPHQADLQRETHRLAAKLLRHFCRLLQLQVERVDEANPAGQTPRFDLEAAMRQMGIRPNRGDLSSSVLDLPQYYQLLALAAPDLQASGFFLELGNCFDITDAGLLGYASLSVENFRQSWELTTKHYALYPHPLRARRDITQGRVCIRLPTPSRQTTTNIYLQEEWLTSTWKWMHQRLPSLAGRPELQLKLGYPAPAYADRYRALFPGPVSFGHEETELSFPEAWYDTPFPTANPATARLCQEQCSLILSQLDTQSDLVNQVRRALLLSPQRHFSSLEALAHQFQLPPHTFHRRLKKAGTSYKHIASEVRMELAKEYLTSTTLPLQEISYLLGYDYAANFFRAFKKWFGVTAAQYRQVVTAAP